MFGVMRLLREANRKLIMYRFSKIYYFICLIVLIIEISSQWIPRYKMLRTFKTYRIYLRPIQIIGYSRGMPKPPPPPHGQNGLKSWTQFLRLATFAVRPIYDRKGVVSLCKRNTHGHRTTLSKWVPFKIDRFRPIWLNTKRMQHHVAS